MATGSTLKTSNKKTPEQWIQLRKELYRQVESQVRHLLGGETVELRKYREIYEKTFRKKWQSSHTEELVNAVNSSRLVLMGDFHAIQQSQKAHLRILKRLKNPNQWVLAVEFFEARHQRIINQFLKGKISERDFLKAIEWKRNWGFPWEHYRPILRYAQKKCIPVLALNARARESISLKERDQFAAKKISRQLANSGRSVFVIFGDLHLASTHLPQSILKLSKIQAKDMVTIFQNSERLYFETLEKGESDQIDLMKMGPHNYCILNVPPWVKWQSYLLYLEHGGDRKLKDVDHDFTDDVLKFLKIISTDLNIQFSENNLAVFSAGDSLFWEKIKIGLKEKEMKWVQSYIQEGFSFYLPNLQIGYLARPTVNHAAALATSILHHHQAGCKSIVHQMPDYFTSLIWQEAIQYFGSKLINPKRKTDTLVDIKAALASRSPSDQGKEALQLALSQKMQELLFLSGAGKVKNIIRPNKSGSYREAARILGGMLGEKIYYGYRNGLVSPLTIQSLLKKRFCESVFLNIYYELIELVEGLPEPFQSKSEKL